MRLSAQKLLADENIHPKVVEYLRIRQCDVRDVFELGLSGHSDADILAKAKGEQWIVLTHDRDFGRLTILMRMPTAGIVYLRPGHIDPQFTIATLQSIDSQDLDYSPSFILVARRREKHVQLRLRRW